MKILGKGVINKDFREIFTSGFIAVTAGVIGGTILLGVADRLEMVPGLFIILPGFLEMHGNIFGSLAARLGTLLHINMIKPEYTNNKLLSINTNASLLLMLFVSLFLGLGAYLINLALFNSNTPVLIIITFLAAIFALAIELPLTIITTIWLFKHGYEPDDIMGPYITTLADVLSIICLFLAVILVT